MLSGAPPGRAPLLGLGALPPLARPSLWCPPGPRPTVAAALAAAASAVWAEDTLAGLADADTTLADGAALLVGGVAYAADGHTGTMHPSTRGYAPGVACVQRPKPDHDASPLPVHHH